MRSFVRPAVVPPELGPNGSGGKKRTEHVEAGVPPTGNLPEHWTKADVRGVLLAMQGHVCAYCSSELPQLASDVEHFRPKQGGYWWLAYVFANYLLSCKPCNQIYKRSKFPLQAHSTNKTFAERNSLDQEERILLDPTVDPIEDWVQVNLQQPVGDDYLKLMPSPAAPNAARVGEAIKFFGLNTRTEFMRARMALLRQAAKAIEQNDAASIAELAMRHSPQSLVCWQLLRLCAPGALPNADQELEWLLGDLCSRLKEKQRLVNGEADVIKPERKEIEELYWAIATLWKSPPTGTTRNVLDMLQSPKTGLSADDLNEISDCYAKLEIDSTTAARHASSRTP